MITTIDQPLTSDIHRDPNPARSTRHLTGPPPARPWPDLSLKPPAVEVDLAEAAWKLDPGPPWSAFRDAFSVGRV